MKLFRRVKGGLDPQRTARFYWLRLIRLQGDPYILARGVAIGVFVGLTPTVPFHTVLVIFFSIVFKGNILAGLISSYLISNPVTLPFQYYFAWQIGSFFMPNAATWDDVMQLLNNFHQLGFLEGGRHFLLESGRITLNLLLGGVILAAPFGVVSYFLAQYIYYRRQKRKYELFLKKRQTKRLRGLEEEEKNS